MHQANGRKHQTGGDASLLELTAVRKSFRVQHGSGKRRLWALDGVDLKLGTGEALGLVGETGCGKSTLGRLLLMLERPDEGQYRFGGIDPLQLRGHSLLAWRRRIQMVFQDPYSCFNPRMSVQDIVAEPWRTRGAKVPAKKSQRVAELLELVGLHARDARRFPHEMSGGQRQRLAIARSLALGPDVLVCDEPLSSLDLSVQAQILNVLVELQERLALSYLFISHDLSVVRYLASRVAVMYLGRIVETGPTEEVFTAPRHPYTAALLSSAPQWGSRPGTGRHGRIVLEGDPPSPVDVPSGCRFRTRCWRAQDLCAVLDPTLESVPGAPDHRFACHFPLAVESATS